MEVQKQKSDAWKAAEALFAEIDADFGKKKKERAKPVPMSRPVVPSEGVLANKLAALMDANSAWRPIARVSHVITQVCRTCLGETEFIGNKLIRHEHRFKKYTWDIQLPETPEQLFLPHAIEPHTQYVESCPSCVRVDLRVMDVDKHNFQLNLFD